MRMSLLLILNILQWRRSGVLIVDFEHVPLSRISAIGFEQQNVCWV